MIIEKKIDQNFVGNVKTAAACIKVSSHVFAMLV